MDEVKDPVGMQQEMLVMVQALHEIVSSSSDAETVRLALSALTSTDAGMSYLRTNPVTI